jgi:hypothetical protein
MILNASLPTILLPPVRVEETIFPTEREMATYTIAQMAQFIHACRIGAVPAVCAHLDNHWATEKGSMPGYCFMAGLIAASRNNQQTVYEVLDEYSKLGPGIDPITDVNKAIRASCF